MLWCLAVFCLSGCQSIAYYTQAAVGQSALLWQSRPIDEVIRDPKTSEPLRDRLRFVESVREYAESVLFLPATGSYRRFTDIGRDFVLWSVVAAEEFSIDPKLFLPAVAAGAAMVEIGNFDSFYPQGRFFSAKEVLALASQTRKLLPDVVLSDHLCP